MADIDKGAIDVLIHYTWDALDANDILDKIDGRIPIIPLKDEPKFSNTDSTYIIYGYTEDFYPEPREIRHGNFAMRIRSKSVSDLIKVTNFLTRLFENADMSARPINAWLSDFDVDGVKPFSGINFGYTDVTYIEGGVPGDQQGSDNEGVVNIQYCYKISQTIKTYRPKTHTWV